MLSISFVRDRSIRDSSTSTPANGDSEPAVSHRKEGPRNQKASAQENTVRKTTAGALIDYTRRIVQCITQNVTIEPPQQQSTPLTSRDATGDSAVAGDSADSVRTSRRVWENTKQNSNHRTHDPCMDDSSAIDTTLHQAYFSHYVQLSLCVVVTCPCVTGPNSIKGVTEWLHRLGQMASAGYGGNEEHGTSRRGVGVDDDGVDKTADNSGQVSKNGSNDSSDSNVSSGYTTATDTTIIDMVIEPGTSNSTITTPAAAPALGYEG